MDKNAKIWMDNTQARVGANRNVRVVLDLWDTLVVQDRQLQVCTGWLRVSGTNHISASRQLPKTKKSRTVLIEQICEEREMQVSNAARSLPVHAGLMHTLTKD